MKFSLNDHLILIKIISYLDKRLKEFKKNLKEFKKIQRIQTKNTNS